MITQENQALIKTAASFFKPWTELKKNPVYLMIERYRTTKLDLPSTISNPFPDTFGFDDYTNDAIEAINKRGRFLTMDELDNISAPTQAMQEAVMDSLKPGKQGGIIGAPAGFGKSYTFKYLGIMAAERSLSHSFLWFKGGALTSTEQLKNVASIKEYHFMFSSAKNLSQTAGLFGGATGPIREMTQAVTKAPDRFILCLDELYDALAFESDAAGGWFALKGLTEPVTLVKIIGTMASKHVPLFKKLKISPHTGQTGAEAQGSRAVYDEQLRSRFHNINVPDYTTAEQINTLSKGGLNAITNQSEFQLQYDPKDKLEIINNLVEKTEDIERGKSVQDRDWAAPRKWKAIISDANSFVSERQIKFAEYTEDFRYLQKTEDLSKWQMALEKIKNEKAGIESSPMPQQSQTNAPQSQPNDSVGIVSLRDLGGKFPHEEVEGPEEIGQQKKERLSGLQEQEQRLQTDMQNVTRKRRYIEIAYQKGIRELESIYGENVFAKDMHDIGFLKPIDIQNVDIGSLKIEEEE